MNQITNFIVLHLNRCQIDFNECTPLKPLGALYKSLGSNMDHVIVSIRIYDLCCKETLSWNKRSSNIEVFMLLSATSLVIRIAQNFCRLQRLLVHNYNPVLSDDGR